MPTDKTGLKKMENDKRQLNIAGRLQTVQQIRRNRNRQQGEPTRIKRQPQQQGRRVLMDQPFRRCGDDGKWKGKLGFCQGKMSRWTTPILALFLSLHPWRVFDMNIYIYIKRWLARH